MRKRRLAWVLLLATVLITLTAAFWLRPSREPEYQGRKLSEWLERLRTPSQPEDYTNSTLAVREIGTNAIPWLLNELDARDSWLKQRMISIVQAQRWVKISIKTEEYRNGTALVGFRFLGPDAAGAMPALIRRLHQPESAELAFYALFAVSDNVARYGPSGERWEVRPRSEALEAIRHEVTIAGLSAATNQDFVVRAAGIRLLADGSGDATLTVPVLIEALKDYDIQVRLGAAAGLGLKTSQPVAAIPPLIAALSDSAFPVRLQAARSLGSYYRQARTAVPALLKARSDPNSMVRAAVSTALDKIDPETAASIPDLPDFKPLPPASTATP